MFVRDFQERHAVWLARLAVVLALLISAWWVFGDVPQPPSPDAKEEVIYRDRDLYNEVIGAVARGENYYAAAAELHRKHEYPTTPWVTVRLPTQAWVSAWLGQDHTLLLIRALVLAAAAAWMGALFLAGYSPFEVLAAGIAVLAGGFIVFYDHYFLHEFWAGAILALAFALYRPGRPWLTIALVICACAVREFSVLVIGTGLVLCAIEKRKGEGAGWLLAGLAVAAFYFWHAQQVIAIRLPGDEISQGWSAMIGPVRALYAVAANSIYRAPGFAIGGVLLIVSVFGLLAARERAWLIAPVAGAWIVVIALLSRPENYYWSQFLLPWLPVGLVLFPRLVLTALKRAKPQKTRLRMQ